MGIFRTRRVGWVEVGWDRGTKLVYYEDEVANRKTRQRRAMPSSGY